VKFGFRGVKFASGEAKIAISLDPSRTSGDSVTLACTASDKDRLYEVVKRDLNIIASHNFINHHVNRHANIKSST